MAFYRGQTTTQQKIQAIASLRITTKAEAIAFLRAISNIEIQIADILQRSNMQDVAARNQAKPIERIKEEAVVVQEEVPEEKEISFDDGEEHTEKQKKSRVAKLKKALKEDA